MRFANAFTPAPATLPGHASLLTGLYPYGHGVRYNGSYPLTDAPSHGDLPASFERQADTAILRLAPRNMTYE